jgi:hypothetical protein
MFIEETQEVSVTIWLSPAECLQMCVRTGYVEMFTYVYSTYKRICFGGLFNDAVCQCQDYIVSDDKMINEWWIGKYLNGSGSGLIEVMIDITLISTKYSRRV